MFHKFREQNPVTRLPKFRVGRPFSKKKISYKKKSAVSCVIDLMRSAVQHSVSNQGRNCRSTGKINSTVVLLLADRAVITGMAWQDEQS